MGSQTALSLREKEQKNYKSYVAIDINFPPLQAAAKQGPCSLKSWKGAKDEQDEMEHTFILAYTELDQYAAKVIRLRMGLLKINPRLPRCSEDLCSYFADG